MEKSNEIKGEFLKLYSDLAENVRLVCLFVISLFTLKKNKKF